MYSARQAAEHYAANQRRAVEALGWYQELRIYCRQVAGKIDTQAAAARLELAQSYLPRFDAEAIARAEALTGFRGLSRRDAIKAMTREKLVLENTIQRLEVNQTYLDRELLAGPDGTITTKLIETREMLAPWATDCRRFEDLEGFLELVALGYDTPQFQENWWQASYWRHWGRGDEICRQLGLDDFGDDVLPAYLKVAEQRDFWQAEVAKLEAELQAVHQLVQTHDQAVARVPQLPSLYLQQCQALLAEYLDQADFALLEDWLTQAGEDRAVLVGLRKCAGLKMKSLYLQELERDGIDRLLGELDARANKYQRKVNKYLRPKNAWQSFPPQVLDQKFEAKHAKLRAGYGQLHKLIDRLDRYDRYQRFDLANEPDLWWYEFTGSRPPRQLPRVRQWYERNPSRQPAHDKWDEVAGVEAARAVAEVAAARQPDDVGYLS